MINQFLVLNRQIVKPEKFILRDQLLHRTTRKVYQNLKIPGRPAAIREGSVFLSEMELSCLFKRASPARAMSKTKYNVACLSILIQ